MAVVRLPRQLIIEMDALSGEIEYKNPDKLCMIEALGMIEICKLLITREFMNEEE